MVKRSERTDSQSKLTRRSLISAVGAGLASGIPSRGSAARAESEYVLVQDGECVPVRPFDGSSPVETFYEYHLPERYASDTNGALVGGELLYASAGTGALQRQNTSIAFLYRGPQGLSLVVVHGTTDSDSPGGSVTFEFSGLPTDGRWVVLDDLYRNLDTGERASTNYDRWAVEGTHQRVDWTWGANGTDGGAFRGLEGDLDVTVRPAFNEDAALYGEHYEGEVSHWEFLSGSVDEPERVSLRMDRPIRIRTGGCANGGTSGASSTSNGDQTKHDQDASGEAAEKDQRSGDEKQEEKEERKEEKKAETEKQKEEKQERKEERKKEKEERKEEKQEEKEERKEEKQEEKEERKEEKQEEKEERKEEKQEEKEERKKEKKERKDEKEDDDEDDEDEKDE